MVYIVMSRLGLDRLLQSGLKPGVIWLNANITSEEHVKQLRNVGWDVTAWTSGFDPRNAEQLSDAIHTVQEHHEGESIWLEIVE